MLASSLCSHNATYFKVVEGLQVLQSSLDKIEMGHAHPQAPTVSEFGSSASDARSPAPRAGAVSTHKAATALPRLLQSSSSFTLKLPPSDCQSILLGHAEPHQPRAYAHRPAPRPLCPAQARLDLPQHWPDHPGRVPSRRRLPRLQVSFLVMGRCRYAGQASALLPTRQAIPHHPRRAL